MKKSRWYFISLAVVLSLLLLVNVIINFSWHTLLNYGITLLLVPGVTFLLAYLLGLLPKSFYNPFKKIFKVFKWEAKFYETLGVRKYKDRIPELGKALTGFDKSKVEKPDDPEYIYTFLTENTKGSFLHAISIIWGVISIVPLTFIFKDYFIYSMAIPAICINTFYHFLPLSTLRYLRPRLIKLYNISLKKIERRKSNEKE